MTSINHIQTVDINQFLYNDYIHSKVKAVSKEIPDAIELLLEQLRSISVEQGYSRIYITNKHYVAKHLNLIFHLRIDQTSCSYTEKSTSVCNKVEISFSPPSATLNEHAFSTQTFQWMTDRLQRILTRLSKGYADMYVTDLAD